MSGPVYRELTDFDLDDLVQLEGETLDPPWSFASLQSFLAGRRSSGLAPGAWIDDTLVGAALAAWTGDRVELYRLAVRAAHRRRGLARALVAQVVTRARKMTAPGVDVELRADNRGARSFYAQIGFREVGRRVGYYRTAGRGEGGAVDALLLSLELGDSPREPGATSR